MLTQLYYVLLCITWIAHSNITNVVTIDTRCQQLALTHTSSPHSLDLQPVDIKSRWRHNWKSAQVVNSHLVCDPTIRQPGFDLPRQQRSLLNRFCTEQGHCSDCRRKWRLTDTDLCPCGETQTMSHILESCPLTKLNGGYLGHTLLMKMLFRGRPVMVHNMNIRRRRPHCQHCHWRHAVPWITAEAVFTD